MEEVIWLTVNKKGGFTITRKGRMHYVTSEYNPKNLKIHGCVLRGDKKK